MNNSSMLSKRISKQDNIPATNIKRKGDSTFVVTGSNSYSTCKHTPNSKCITPQMHGICKSIAEKDTNHEDKQPKKLSLLSVKPPRYNESLLSDYNSRILQIREDLNTVDKEVESLKNQKCVMRELLNDSVNVIELTCKKYTTLSKLIEEINNLDKIKISDTQYKAKAKSKICEVLINKCEDILSFKDELISKIKNYMDLSYDCNDSLLKTTDKSRTNASIEMHIESIKRDLDALYEQSSIKEKVITQTLIDSTSKIKRYSDIKAKYDDAQTQIKSLKSLLSKSHITKLAKILEFIPYFREEITNYQETVISHNQLFQHTEEYEQLQDSKIELDRKLIVANNKIETLYNELGKLNQTINKQQLQLQSFKYIKENTGLQEKILQAKVSHANEVIGMLKVQIDDQKATEEDESRNHLIRTLTDQVNQYKSDVSKQELEIKEKDAIIAQYKDYILSIEVEAKLKSPSTKELNNEQANKIISSLVGVILSKKSSANLNPEARNTISMLVGEDKIKQLDENIDRIGKIEGELSQVSKEKDALNDKFKQTTIYLKKMIDTFSQIVKTIKNDSSYNHTSEFSELKEKLINYEALIEEKAKGIFKNNNSPIEELSNIKEETMFEDSTTINTLFSGADGKNKEEVDKYRQEIAKLKEELYRMQIQYDLISNKVDY